MRLISECYQTFNRQTVEVERGVHDTRAYGIGNRSIGMQSLETSHAREEICLWKRRLDRGFGMEVLDTSEMERADGLTIAAGTPGFALMLSAGQAVAAIWPVCRRAARPHRVCRCKRTDSRRAARSGPADKPLRGGPRQAIVRPRPRRAAPQPPDRRSASAQAGSARGDRQAGPRAPSQTWSELPCRILDPIAFSRAYSLSRVACLPTMHTN